MRRIGRIGRIGRIEDIGGTADNRRDKQKR